MSEAQAPKQHQYATTVIWTGDRGGGARTYRGYDRTWDMAAAGKATAPCSNDPLLGGDATKYNPEDLLLSALSACHMLWCLHLAADAGLVVHSYHDSPLGVGETAADGAGRFLRATLRPTIEVEAGADLACADALHHEARRFCFIARPVSFPVDHQATYLPRAIP